MGIREFYRGSLKSATIKGTGDRWNNSANCVTAEYSGNHYAENIGSTKVLYYS